VSRLRWSELPGSVVAAVESVLGEPVLAVDSQSSGFSDGSADRVRTASGRTAFVKAARSPDTAGLHRREVAVLEALPPGVPAPRLLGTFDDGEWVALVISDVAGRHADSGSSAAVLSSLANLPTASGLSLPTAAEGLGWKSPPMLPGLEPLAVLARSAPAAMAGEHLVHLDLRCDNVLIDPDGAVVIVDWPWASRGAPWIDALTFLLDLRRLEGIDGEKVLAGHPLFASVAASDVTAVLAGLALTFFDAAHRDSAPRELREFQLSEGHAAMNWVRQRAGGLLGDEV
jgi:hypothetical protein